MSKTPTKKTAPKTRTRRRTKATAAKTPPPPAGLVAAFAMINEEGSTPIAAPWTARRAYGPALQIIDLLHADEDERDAEVDDGAQGVAIGRVLDRATDAVHGQCFDDAHANPQLTRDTAFHVGYAVCWLLMTAVSGGAR